MPLAEPGQEPPCETESENLGREEGATEVIEYCPICGHGPALGYASFGELRSSFEICDCCGCEFGYDDNLTHFENWVASGTNWSNPKARPLNWSLEKQLSHTIRPWPPAPPGEKA